MPQNNTEAQLRGVTEWDEMHMQALVSLTSLKHWKFAPNSRFESGVLTQLSRLKFLQSLGFQGSELERANLRALASLKALRRLDLKSCQFARDDFAFLCEQWAQGTSPRLTEIGLKGTPVSDDELFALNKIKRLRILRLTDAVISDAGLKHLVGLRKLETLAVGDTGVSEEGMIQLAVLPRLGSLGFFGDDKKTTEIHDRFFRAQVALQKSKKPLDVEQAEAAGICLRTFMKTAQDWTRTFLERSSDVYRAEEMKGESSIDVEAISKAFDRRWNDMTVTKNAIARKFYSNKMMERDGPYPSVGDPRTFQYRRDWIDVDTPSPTRTIFYAEDWYEDGGVKKRYTMVFEDSEWKLENTEMWCFGWKPDYF